MIDAECDIGSRHRQAADDIETGGIFGACRAQEFTPRRHASEQILDDDPRPRRHRGGGVADEIAIVDRPRPAFRARDAAVDRQARDAGDRWQGLTAKAQRLDRLDPFVGKFRGGMAFERERHIVSAHPAAIVADLDPREPALGQHDTDSRRARIDRVFDQFLQRAGGSFDHFTGSDAIDQMFGETTY